MARFYGLVGYGHAEEKSPGVYEDVITEKAYFGDVLRNARGLGESDATTGVNRDVSLQNTISIVADPYAREHFHAMRYIRWAGALWTVSTVEVQFPRLLLRLGPLYNGPIPEVSDG